jgi:hypothetical protein
MFRASIVDRSASGVRVTTVPGWAIGLGAVGAAFIGLVVLVLGAGLALLLAPVAIGALLIARWRLRRMMADIVAQSQQQRRQAAPDGVIDVEYRVIDDAGKR